MIYKRFRFSILWRILVIVSLSWIGTIIWYHSSIYVAFAIVTILWLLMVIELLRHIFSIEKSIERFFNTFQTEGESISFNKTSHKYFPEFENKIPAIIKAYNDLAARREKDYRLFNQTMLQAGIGIITFDARGKIHFCNKAALLLLEKEYFANISALNNGNPGFSDVLQQLTTNKPIICNYVTPTKSVSIEIKSIDFNFDNQQLKLITLLNVSSTVEQGEIQAMQRLIRYMQHEIMNSLSPITLISGKLKDDCMKVMGYCTEESKEALETISTGLHTINIRSQRLTEFFDGYRKLADLPAPKYSVFYINDIFKHIKEVMNNELLHNNIALSTQIIPENLSLNADEGQIQLVIINLVKNAIEALDHTKKPRIKLIAVMEDDSVTIKIIDNGPGIPDEIKESVFMPYFTTKEYGSGIGLSIIKQILRNHNATINFTSVPNEKTEFSIKF